MLKGLSRLWLRGLKQISKAQQSQQKKLVKSLLAKPAASKRAPKKSTAAVRSAKPAAPAKPAIASRPAPLPGKWLASYYSSFAENGALPARRMNYWLYLPAGADAASLPLVVMLHGCEQSATQFSDGTRMNQLAEQKGFAVLYPQQSLKAHPNRCWHWYDKATQEGGGDVQLIAGIVESVMQKYPIDPRRVYVAGISAGGAMAHILAMNYPHLFAAVGLHSAPVFGATHTRMGAYAVMQRGSLKPLNGGLHEPLNKNAVRAKMPAILVHGQADKVVRSINLAQLAQQFREVNQLSLNDQAPAVFKAASSPKSKNPRHAYKIFDYHSGTKLLLRVCEVHQLEHAWSGGDGSLRFNSSAGPDASKMMWDFFARHRRYQLKPLKSTSLKSTPLRSI